MAVPQQTVWDIDPHTVAKHEILHRYLGAWFPILGAHNKRIVYIDGFCGPGRYSGGEAGSPIIALQQAMSHSQRLAGVNVVFLFVDERPDRIAHLKHELSDFSIPSNFSVSPETGEFADKLRLVLDDLDSRGKDLAPTFAFIDLFGFKGLPFDLVARLLGNPKTEVLVNVMIDSINRWLEHPDPKIQQHIVDLFGTSDVLKIAQAPGDRRAQLRLLYQSQLSKHARFVRYFEMRDCHGDTIYYLFFAGNHPLGHTRMKEAFWKADPSSGFRFSDATNPDQLVLFENEQGPMLADDLAMLFSGRRVVAGKVLGHVQGDTALLGTHARDALKLLEAQERIRVDECKQDGKKRKKGTYPDNAIIQFV